ncbi:hypothetical protein GCM10011613_30570 [Cellvibrio zantedeschiae]|uniref:Uncharacterized protein n=1 Tax=Cellvibrio zantedeschiae TaxID=1237077 RepID=A0ABQ3BBX5_9GAMM|nr:hypothetical protein [Cellvibrio zantedeschiae]GGY83558.1 hypothetical protein GCM10011613_30570 [Cellvibrio zantedeschiae]
MEFLNKVIFVSKKLIMEDGKVYFDNYFVTVKAINDEALVVVKPNGEEENLPKGEDFYDEADEGLYELDDGTSYEDPDYIGEFLIFENDVAYEKFKDEH